MHSWVQGLRGLQTCLGTRPLALLGLDATSSLAAASCGGRHSAAVFGHQGLHTSSTTCSGDAPSTSSSSPAVHSPLQSPQPHQHSPLQQTPQPHQHSPLQLEPQAFDDSPAEQSPTRGRGAGLIKVLAGRRVPQDTPHGGLAPVLVPTTREWLWYDERDERDEQRRERRRQWPDLGHACLENVPQSQKKMDRVLALVRGLPFKEAVIQCKSTPHKATRYVLQALDHAHEDAVAKKLDPKLLVVGLIWSTKGVLLKATQPLGRGNSARCYSQKCHIQVVLRPDAQYEGFRSHLVGGKGARPVGRATDFRARLVAPVMHRAQPPRQRPSFAYHDQV